MPAFLPKNCQNYKTRIGDLSYKDGDRGMANNLTTALAARAGVSGFYGFSSFVKETRNRNLKVKAGNLDQGIREG